MMVLVMMVKQRMMMNFSLMAMEPRKIESEPDMNAMIGESIYIPSSVEIPFLQNLYR